jgi:hypothetical protein
MSQTLKADSLALWRLARDVEPNGIDRDTAARLLSKEGQALSDHLFRLTKVGYLTRDGLYGQGRWRIGNRVPNGEQLAPPPPPPAPPPPPPASPLPKGKSDNGDDDLQDRREPVKGVPPGVPNSVFALGSMAAQLPPEATLPDFTALPPAPVPTAAADLSGWKPAKPLVASAEAAPAAHDQAELPEVLQHHVRMFDGQPWSGTVTQVTQGVPRFSLGSDGTFAIEFNNPGRITRLNPEATRAMFSFLDRLGGLDLTRLVTEPEAAS